MPLEQLQDWQPYSDRKQPVWFWVITNINSDLANLGMEGMCREVRQELKTRSLKALNLRGNMLNLREKHIPRIKEIYKEILDGYAIRA